MLYIFIFNFILKEIDHMEHISHTWEENIEAEFYIKVCYSVNWIPLPRDKDKWRSHGNTVINFPLPQNKWTY
jgi:hypothetical protein